VHPPIDAAERERIIEEFHRQLADPLPPGRGALGPPLLLAAVAILLLAPLAGRLTGLALAGPALVFAAAAGLAGFYFRMFGESTRFRARDARLRAGLERLRTGPVAAGSADPDVRRAAVAVLAGARVADGPTEYQAFDPDAEAARLGDGLAYLLEAERVLLAARLIPPCFTASSDTRASPGGGADS
jgi:hypothetical protein